MHNEKGLGRFPSPVATYQPVNIKRNILTISDNSRLNNELTKKTGLNSMLIITVLLAQIILQYLIPVRKATIVAIIDFLTNLSAFVIIPLAIILHSRHNLAFILQIVRDLKIIRAGENIIFKLSAIFSDLKRNKVDPYFNKC